MALIEPGLRHVELQELALPESGFLNPDFLEVCKNNVTVIKLIELLTGVS